MKDNKKKPTQKVKVLYQNLGGQWYAFADLGGGDNLFVGRVSTTASAEKSKEKTTAEPTKSKNTKEVA